MMEVIPMARNASYMMPMDNSMAADLFEPALQRKSSTRSDKVVVRIPKLSSIIDLAPQKNADELIKIQTNETEDLGVPVCKKIQKKCGHACYGVKGEKRCLPCIEPSCAPLSYKGGQDADQLCGICYTSELGSEACSKLGCGHVFHTDCIINLLKHRWTTLKISFAFMSCP